MWHAVRLRALPVDVASIDPTIGHRLLGGRWGLGDRALMGKTMKARVTVEVSIDRQWLRLALLAALFIL